MGAFTMADFHEKNRRWFTDDAFLIGNQGPLTHSRYTAGVAGMAEFLQAEGAGPGDVLAIGVGGAVCAFLYGLADSQGYRITMVDPQVESGQWRSLLAAGRPAMVAVAVELEEEAVGVLQELPGRYRAVGTDPALPVFPGVNLYTVTDRDSQAGFALGTPHMFLQQEGTGARIVALTAESLMDAVRVVCAELTLNHHDRCLWALATASLLGRLAMASVFFRGAAGTEEESRGAVPLMRPTVVFTDRHGSGGTDPGAPEGPDQPKVVRLLAGAELAQGAYASVDPSSATLAAVGSPLPTFRVHACDAAGPDRPAGAVLAAPLLGVEVKLVGESGTETAAVESGRLLIRARFAPLVATAADAGSALAGLTEASAGEDFVRTGYLAQWAQPGRMWLWPDPGDGNSAQEGGRL